ncbi:MAG: TlpA family protein disulfide reductase [Proteobacteria bacterium]|nr:TlpA family protein disulfide reductase [Pseudomonadota bacterium]MBU1709012.1 TlpA family protein disulfide reductase [Pseudomonadota bacterium]
MKLKVSDSRIQIIIFFLLIFSLVACGKDKVQPLKKGGKVPVFSAIDMEGNEFSLAGFAGRPVILRFWSTDCKFCRADTPVFNKYYEKYKEQGLMITYINTTQGRDAVQEFIKELEVVFPVIRDEQGKIAASYNVKLQPMTIVLSPEHTLLAAILGGVSEAALAELVGPYMVE